MDAYLVSSHRGEFTIDLGVDLGNELCEGALGGLLSLLENLLLLLIDPFAE